MSRESVERLRALHAMAGGSLLDSGAHHTRRSAAAAAATTANSGAASLARRLEERRDRGPEQEARAGERLEQARTRAW